jgi:hypothetical protein
MAGNLVVGTAMLAGAHAQVVALDTRPRRGVDDLD